MAYSVLFTPGAQKAFGHLPKKVQAQLAPLLDDLAHDPFTLSGLKKLKPPLMGFRLRSGDYRVLFVVEKPLIKIYDVAHRKDAYRV